MTITTAHIIEKFERILVHISQEEKQKLTKELAKIVPWGVASLLDWRVSWAYNFDANQIEAKFHLKVQHFAASEVSVLDEILPLFLANDKLLTETEDILDKLIKEGSTPYHLYCREVIFLENGAAFLRFSFSADFSHAKEKYKELATLHSQEI
jgi:hypothetical protein